MQLRFAGCKTRD